MALTTPDSIRTPNDSDQYALVQDMGAMADSVQNALVKRANAYVGSPAQRAAFSAPEGTVWTDSDGSSRMFIRQDGAWRANFYAGRVGPLPMVAANGVTTANVNFSAANFAADPIIVVSLVLGTSRNLDLRVSALSPTSATFRIGNYSTSDLPAGQYLHYHAIPAW